MEFFSDKLNWFVRKSCVQRFIRLDFSNTSYIFGKKRSKLGDSMSKFSIILEFWQFLKVNKKWWLIPIIISLLLLGALIVFAEGSAMAPFIYTLF